MIRQIRLNNRKKAGFTLIEFIVATAIFALISVSLMAIVFQTLNTSHKSSAKLIAVKQIENAVDLMSRDAAAAQDLSEGDQDTGFTLTLTRASWNGHVTKINYVINDDHQLVRIETVLDDINNTLSSNTMVIANYLNYVQGDPTSPTLCDYKNGILSVKLSCTIGETIEERQFNVYPRAQ